MEEQPFFSVVIPTHRRPGLLHRNLNSIRSQTFGAKCEVIVVSDVIDGHTDQVCANILSASDTYVRRGGSPGPSQSRNLGLRLAKGQYLLFLDDDDAWHPDFLNQLYLRLPADPKVPVYFDCSVVEERRLPIGPEFVSESRLVLAGKLNDLVYVKNQVHLSCFSFPRFLLDGLTFDDTMRAYEDWEYLLCVLGRSRAQHLPILGSQVHEVSDETSDRRGSSSAANDFHAVLDYLYVYRRHPAPTEELQRLRSQLIARFGIDVPPRFL